MRNTIRIALALAAVAAVPAASTAGSSAFYAVDITGKSYSTLGPARPFTGDGSMNIDETAGAISYDILLDTGSGYVGSGEIAVTPRGRFFGSATPEFEGLDGAYIIEGKFSADRESFRAKLTTATPNLDGPPPAGFVLSKMKVKGRRPAK